MCGTHYQQWRRTGSPDTYPKGRGECKAKGCHRLNSAHGYCATHLQRYYRHGSALEAIPIGMTMLELGVLLERKAQAKSHVHREERMAGQ